MHNFCKKKECNIRCNLLITLGTSQTRHNGQKWSSHEKTKTFVIQCLFLKYFQDLILNQFVLNTRTLCKATFFKMTAKRRCPLNRKLMIHIKGIWHQIFCRKRKVTIWKSSTAWGISLCTGDTDEHTVINGESRWRRTGAWEACDPRPTCTECIPTWWPPELTGLTSHLLLSTPMLLRLE